MKRVLPPSCARDQLVCDRVERRRFVAREDERLSDELSLEPLLVGLGVRRSKHRPGHRHLQPCPCGAAVVGSTGNRPLCVTRPEPRLNGTADAGPHLVDKRSVPVSQERVREGQVSTAIVEAPTVPSDRPPLGCPVCGDADVRLTRSAAELAGDLRAAASDGRQLMHSTPVSVYRCDGCRSIFRDPAAVQRDLEARYGLDASIPNGSWSGCARARSRPLPRTGVGGVRTCWCGGVGCSRSAATSAGSSRLPAERL